ncbi:nitrate- and nitrite sensing domain-containing protein [Streptomyces sp. NPDC059740]|uniref:sensor histidine kinase n=1 Tax=Streptomyces sp. NPDC059740 TaxID=3346926 RepID=UPI0036515F88
MRLRGRPLRRRFLILLLLPLLPLTAIWMYATYLTGSQAWRLLESATAVDVVAPATETTVRALQSERKEALRYLADRRRVDAVPALHARTRATDTAVRRLREAIARPEADEALSGTLDTRVDTLLRTLHGLPGLRTQVEGATVSHDEAFTTYTALLAPCFDLLTGLRSAGDAHLAEQSDAVVALARAREDLAQEDALASTALLTGTLTAPDLRTFADVVAVRRSRLTESLPRLPAADRNALDTYRSSAPAALLAADERRLTGAHPGRLPSTLTTDRWRTDADGALAALAHLASEASTHQRARLQPVIRGAVFDAGICGVLGVVALLLSVLVSYRVGRRHVRALVSLRDTAHEMAGVRLPGVMRRLAAGEKVDVAAEAPYPQFGPDETGQVGHALGTLHRAAVEAAVKQAELRHGVSEMFVNLARRNQVLLHRQLRLLDAMERRTEDTGELADLFRLDHLTTRMRRHAEGLVILSGAPPSRQWRRPIPLLDVVRAAVAEVEDFLRIEVRPLPRLAVDGSAVADLTHLVAELLENATAFSPPDSPVRVQGELVSNGVALEIHDRGLGMSADALLDANQRLAQTPEFTLSDTDRLGLFVVSRLARRQSARVTLQTSPYGGVTAVVLLPPESLRDVPAPAGDRDTPPDPQPPGERTLTAGDGGPDAAHDTAGRPALPARPHLADTPEPPAAPQPSAPATTRSGLPRRVPQAGAAPRSPGRRNPAAAGDTRERPADAPTTGPEPEQPATTAHHDRGRPAPDPQQAARPTTDATRDALAVRARMTALQQGWQRGRSEEQSSAEDTDTTTGGEGP